MERFKKGNMTVLSSPAQVIQRLEEIDADLANRQNDFETAASAYYHAKRHWEKSMAEAYVNAQGSNQKERESRAILAEWKANSYRQFVLAEAEYEGHKAAIRTLETRASIGQSLLRAQSRDLA
jgi:hypothetical protein